MKEVKKSEMFIIVCVALSMLTSVLVNIATAKKFASFWIFTLSGGTMLSWCAFYCNDIITEIMGLKFAKKVNLMNTLACIGWAVIATIIMALPAIRQDVQTAWKTIFSSSLRIAIASPVSMFIGNHINNMIMDRMHKKDKEKKYIKRAIVSTAFGQFVDNALFQILAFAPIGLTNLEFSWKIILSSIVSVTIMETVIESVFTPISNVSVKKIKRLIEAGN